MSSGGPDHLRLRDRLGVVSGVELQQTSTSYLSSNSKPQTSRNPLNNARTDVIGTIETLPDSTVKYLFRIIYVSIFLAVLGVIALMVMKLGYESRLHSNKVLIWNTVVASCGIFSLFVCAGCYLKRLYLVNSRKMNWSDRRRKGSIVFCIELSTQLLNLCFYLIPNVYLLVDECAVYGKFPLWMGFCRMTCWNTLFLLFLIMSSNLVLVKRPSDEEKQEEKRPDESVFDKPFYVHAPKFLLWVAAEAFFLLICIYMDRNDSNSEDGERTCLREEVQCHVTRTIKYFTVGAAFVFLSYFFGSIYFFKKGFKRLSEKQYLNYRLSNILIRLQLRLQMIVHCFHLLSFGLLWFVRIDSCASFVLSWLGFLPSQFAMTVILVVKCYLFIPLKPAKEDLTLQMWLREYSWSEEELPDLVGKRGNGCCTSTEPMFCFERAVKTLYWSNFIYDYKQVPDSKLTLKVAMHLYDLTEYELFHEHLHDTKLMVAWNQKMVLLAFRGTSSLKNIFADLRIARIAHPPVRGGFMSQPMVHRGFLQTWTSNGLNNRVLELLKNIIKDRKDFFVLLTGHSLGGALATLAAYDIRVHLNVPPCSIECYTFGAPRVGNYAFAHDYDLLVPNTWSVINDQDYITRTMKLMFLYKRPGQRVIMNSQGDMLVRPSFIEMSLSRTTGAVNILHHLLSSYEKAFLAVARAQFSGDSIEGGYEGMLRISNTLKHVLGLSRVRLIQELSWGNRIRELEKRKRREQSKLHAAVSSTKQFGHDLVESLSQWWEMDGVDMNVTRLCGRKTCEVIDLELKQGGGLSFETGHVSLDSQRTESEGNFLMELNRMQEEPDPSNIV